MDPHFRILRRHRLHERRPGDVGQPSRDLALARSGGARHEDVGGVDLITEVVILASQKLLPPPPVPERHGDRALRRGLSYDVRVELFDDVFAGTVAGGCVCACVREDGMSPVRS